MGKRQRDCFDWALAQKKQPCGCLGFFKREVPIFVMLPE
jgi:hypothetical protein